MIASSPEAILNEYRPLVEGSTDIRYSYRDAPTIRAFSDDRSFFRGLMGPFGSGKSSGCVAQMIELAHEQLPGKGGIRKSRFAAIRNTYPQLKDTTIRTVLDWLPERHFGKFNQTDHIYTVTGFEGVEFEIWFRALDRPDQVSNLLSMEVTAAWVNEAREIPWTIIQALKGRVGRFPSMREGGPTWSGIFMDTNPPDDDSWWHKLFEEDRPDNAKLFKQPSGLSANAENLKHLRKSYYADLCSGAGEEFIRVYVKGEYGYVQDGKPVYPEYNDAIHCSDQAEYVKGLTVIRGWDFGLTPACVFSQRLPSGRWITFDELIGDSIGIDRFSDRVIERSAQYGSTFEDWGDPAGQQRSQTDEVTCFQILHGKQINIMPSDQDLMIRVESVKRGLNTMFSGQPALQIHPRCKLLRKGYKGKYRYRRMQTTAERWTDQPEKDEFSHPHDANQYAASKVFGALVKSRSTARKPLDYSRVGAVV